MKLRAFDRETDREVFPGEKIRDFRGEEVTLQRLCRPTTEGTSGKLLVKEKLGWKNDNAYGLYITMEYE